MAFNETSTTLTTGTGLTKMSYNGVIFDSFRKSHISFVPIKDDADRKTKYIEYTIRIEARASFATNTVAETTMRSLRRALTRSGRKLYVQSVGFGPLVVNVAPVFDAKWGPKPHIVEWTPLGGAIAAIVNYEIVTRVPECPDGKPARYQRAITMFNYDVTWENDEAGYSRVTTTGALEVPLTFTPDGKAPLYTADDFREKCYPKLLDGYRRLPPRFTLSKDRTRLDFSITDEAIPVPYPCDVATIDANQRVKWSFGKDTTARVGVSIDANIRMPARTPRIYAASVFNNIVTSRMAKIRQEFRRIYRNTAGEVIIPNTFEASEQIYGKDGKFQQSFTVMGRFRLRDLINLTALWRSIPDGCNKEQSTWSMWRAVMRESGALHPRGADRLRYQGGLDDVLIDVCEDPAKAPNDPGPTTRPFSPTKTRPPWRWEYKPPPTPPPPPPPPTTRRSTGHSSVRWPFFPDSGPLPEIPELPNPLRQTPTIPLPTFIRAPEAVGGGQDWLLWDCDVMLIEDDRIARHSRIGGTVNESTPSDGTRLNGLNRGLMLPVQSPETDKIQRLGPPIIRVRLVGRAARADADPFPPRLVSVGGVNAVQSGQVLIRPSQVDAGGIIINAISWSIDYELTGVPKTMPRIANPLARLEGVS